MSHIVIDARESGTTSGRYVDKMIEHMHRIGTDHHVTLLAKSKRLEYLRGIAPTFEIVETPYQEFSLGEQLGFKRQIESLKPDLVHFPMVQQPAFYRGRVVTTMQDLTTIRFRNPAKNAVVFWAKQQIYKWLNKRVAHRSTHIITISEFVKKDVASYCHIPLGKITVTLESSDEMPPGSAPYDPVHEKPFIMYVGRPTPHKNLRRLIDAFVLLQKTNPELKLVLAGKKDANYALHEAYVKKQDIKNVIFTDFIPDDQLRWLFENCRAYIFPSLSEGFGLPGLEAMRHGAPVVASTATSIPEVLGDAAEYFDPYDVQDMANKIDLVINDQTKRSKMIEAGKHQAAKYSWRRMAQQTLDVYSQALKS
jgi:glycosyltransferase involved in cell wall biosynthesis